MSTNENTENLRDDNYTPEDLKNALAVYGSFETKTYTEEEKAEQAFQDSYHKNYQKLVSQPKMKSTERAEVEIDLVEKWLICAATNNYSETITMLQSHLRKAYEHLKRAKEFEVEYAKTIKESMKSPEKLAEVFTDEISMVVDGWFRRDYRWLDDAKDGVSVDGFIDTLALVKQLVSLGVIVINEDEKLT